MKFQFLFNILIFISFQQSFSSFSSLSSIFFKLSPQIALTRDQESNKKIQQVFRSKGIKCLDLPCLEFSSGNDKITREHLKNFDTIIITSSQGAKNLINSWKEYQKPSIKVASIGSATTDILNLHGLKPFFQPTIATAKSFGAELPLSSGRRVLYPTSNLADTILEELLTSRGFDVTRLNVYQTNSPEWNHQMYVDARNVDFVTFFSPSAVNIWANRVGTNFTAIVIGPTTKKAAIQRGFREVYSSDSIGSESLLEVIKKVLNNRNSLE